MPAKPHDPKVQMWISRPERRAALDAAYDRAKALGKTRARSAAGWVSEWVVEAAEGQLRPGGTAGEDLPRDREFIVAAERLREAYSVADITQVVRMAVLAAHRRLEAGQDPFRVEMHRAAEKDSDGPGSRGRRR